ncbi:MAG: HD domain-containing phosphohydrolase [Syntrophobacteraceae bacterium]
MKLERLEALAFESGNFDASGFKSISIHNLTMGEPLQFNIYAPIMDLVTRSTSLKRIFKKNELFDQPVHDCLKSKKVGLLYIRQEDEAAFSDYNLEKIRRVVASNTSPSKEKVELLYGHAEYVIRKAFSESPTEYIINHSTKMMRTTATQLSMDPIAANELVSIFSKDYYTFTHSVQVSILGMAFCTYLGWPKEEVAHFGVGALFHDIGKSCIDDSILNKPAELDPDEFETMKQHPVMGYEQLTKSDLFSGGQLRTVLHHHENMDGRGYPSGLSGEQIHRYARVVRIVDCFDALTTRRPYKEAIPPEQALKIMKGKMPGCFDPQYLDGFLQYFDMSDINDSFITTEGKGLTAEIGDYLQIQMGGSEERLRVKLLGMDPGSYLITQLPTGAGDLVFAGNQATVRYFSSISGTIYGFKSVILGSIVHPIRIMVLSYPNVAEKHELRKYKRISCFIIAEVRFDGMKVNGVVYDISLGGCKFVTHREAQAQTQDLKQGDKIYLDSPSFADSGFKSLNGLVRNSGLDGARVYIGIEFLDLEPKVLDKLDLFISKLEDAKI